MWQPFPGTSGSASHFILKDHAAPPTPATHAARRWLFVLSPIPSNKFSTLMSSSNSLRGTLRCSTGQAAAELALRAQTVLADIP